MLSIDINYVYWFIFWSLLCKEVKKVVAERELKIIIFSEYLA